MTDKLDPGWRKDRLPTEEDGEQVLHIVEETNICRKSFEDIKKNQFWCAKPDTSNFKWEYDIAHEPYVNYIALPQECIDRAKGETSKIKDVRKPDVDKFGSYVFDGQEEYIEFRNNDICCRYKVKDWIGFSVKCDKLEKELAKEQDEHASTLKRGNEVDDFYERLEKENELLRKLLKSLL